MVEIIKQGELPSERTYVTTCQNCDTIFRFKAGEARNNPINYDPRDQRDYCETKTIPCPFCARQCTVQSSSFEKKQSDRTYLG